MKPNEGSADRAIRVFAGIAFLVVAIGTGLFQGELVGLIVGAVGLISLITGAVGFCPAYAIAGVRTCPLSGKE